MRRLNAVKKGGTNYQPSAQDELQLEFEIMKYRMRNQAENDSRERRGKSF